jgi:hypothetical protein
LQRFQETHCLSRSGQNCHRQPDQQALSQTPGPVSPSHCFLLLFVLKLPGFLFHSIVSHFKLGDKLLPK